MKLPGSTFLHLQTLFSLCELHSQINWSHGGKLVAALRNPDPAENSFSVASAGVLRFTLINLAEITCSLLSQLPASETQHFY